MKPLAPNTMILERYLVVHLIGKGGMGEVYLAVDQRLGSAVALKRTSFADDASLAAAFEREARILARLRHPVLPKVSDHFVDGSDQYLVMEHISGDDLSKRIEAANKPFPVSWVMFWADQLLDALNYLHSHTPPIIHRDIKPQNLKLTDDNHIVLLDFGLSKDSGPIAQGGTGSAPSVVGYTPHFAPLEQIRGTGTDPRSDIYSLSATLYQLITNVTPDDALSRADALLSGKPDPAAAISSINADVSEDVSAVIMRGLEVTQDKRFASAAEMQRELRAAHARQKESMSAKTVVIPTEAAVQAEQPPQPSEPQDQLEATVQMSDVEAQAAFKQADIKTEVLNASDLRQEQPAYAVDMPEPAPASEPEPAVPDATVPYVGLGADLEGTASSASGAGAAEPQFFTEANVSIPEEAETAQPAGTPVVEPQLAAAATGGAAGSGPAATGIAPQQKSSSKGKLLLALLGLGFLFVVLIGGAFGGWYYYENYYKAGSVTPQPSPSATPTPEPTSTPMLASDSPTPTPEPSPSPTAESANPTPTPVSTPGGTVAGTPAATPRPAASPRDPGTRPPKTPTTRPTPRSNDDRTVILQ